MKRTAYILGFLWSLPITLAVFLFYQGPLWALGWVKPVRWDRGAWEWVVVKDTRYAALWARWAASCAGAILTYRWDYLNWEPTRVHERAHMYQCYLLGVFQPLTYALAWVLLKVFLWGMHPYHDNPYEMHARYCAGQPVDHPFRGAAKHAPIIFGASPSASPSVSP